MTDEEQSVSFPLDFNAATWTIEEALSWVFLRSLASGDSNEWECGVAYATARLERRKPAKSIELSIETKKIVDDVLSFLQPFRPTLSGLGELAPVVWSRLATQYWLAHGGCYRPFMSAMGDWLDDLGDTAVRIAHRRKPRSSDESTAGLKAQRRRPQQKKIAIASFLLDSFPADHYRNRLVSLKANKGTGTSSPSQARNPDEALQEIADEQRGMQSDREETLKKMLGPHAYDCVKRVIEDAVSTKSIPKLSAKRDPETERYQFTGQHKNLCKEIFRHYKEEIGNYKSSTLERAVRVFVISRKSWK